MYAYQNNIVSIPAEVLYKDIQLMSYDTYQKHCYRGKLIRTKEGRGEGNKAWVSFYDLPMNIQERVMQYVGGGPKELLVRNQLESYIIPDHEATKFFVNHRTPSGRSLSDEKQREKATSCMILNAIKLVFEDKKVSSKLFGAKKLKIWQNVSNAVNAIETTKWKFKLPTNPRSLERRYKDYLKYGYNIFIHKNEGKTNARIIKGEIANFLLATYALPNKLTIPQVLEQYEKRRHDLNGDQLTEQAIYNFLQLPENKRTWMLGRHGKEVYNKTFKHTLTRDKSDWFPNVYWGIDGTKLDWIHFWDDASNKMGAKLKINVLFDVYSEKIIGHALSFTESHIEHFKAIKMGVNESSCRPYLLTYDHQSGHKMSRMQELYSSLVAKKGGTHYPNAVGQHNNPAEELFRRLQQQVINRFWFSDGQSITVRRDDNKMNPDFIKENKTSLKTVEELYEAWEAAVNIWNNAKHPHFKATRTEVYKQEMPKREELTLFDVMDKMWIEQKQRPIQYKAHGLDLRLGDKKYIFEVLDQDGNIDLEFRRTSIGKKFIVRYDPDFLDGYIQLCEKDDQGNIVHVANAQPKRQHQNVPMLMTEDDKARWAKDYEVREQEYKRDLAVLQSLRKHTGITPEQLIEDQELLIKYKGNLDKVERSKVESQENDFANL